MNEHLIHNQFKSSVEQFLASDPHLSVLSDLKYAFEVKWWQALSLETPGIYILTGLTVGISQISYSTLTQKIGLMSKDTVIEYLGLLERMDVLFNLQAFDIERGFGHPRKNRKFHFLDPFIMRVITNWMQREGYSKMDVRQDNLAESIVASHCYRQFPTYYFKGQGEVDVIYLHQGQTHALEVKWANQVRANDLKMLKSFENAKILTEIEVQGQVENIETIPVFEYLYQVYGAEA